MSLQSDMQAAGAEYARRLEQTKQDERLEALRLEARKHSNGSAFAAAIEDAFDQLDAANDFTITQEN